MKALKRFSQNFLVNPKIISQIIDATCPQTTQTFIEIGPGTGALTYTLCPHIKQLISIEIDPRLVEKLEQKIREQSISNITLIKSDIQKITLGHLHPTPVRLITNLPYHLSSHIILKLIKEKQQLIDAHITVQKEFAQRLFAKPNTKAWGRLSILIQLHMQVEKIFDIDKKNFDPIPQVDSTFIRLIPREKPLFHIQNPPQFNQLVLAGFGQRRKTMRNTLAKHLSPQELEQFSINPNDRAETLSIKQWHKLYTYLESKNTLNSTNYKN